MGRCARVLFADWVSFFAVLAKEVIEALVATDLDHGDLERVPGVLKESLDIALEIREGVLVGLGALSTDERAEGHVAVRAPVVLAVDAEGIKLLFVDAAAQVSRSLGTLRVTLQVGIRQGRIALRLGVLAGTNLFSLLVGGLRWGRRGS